MSVITNKWNDGSGDSISIESPSFKGNQTITISSPVQKGTVKRSITLIGKCSKDSSKTVRLTVEQIASAYTYELLLNASILTIPASGGNSNITAQLKTYRNGGLIETKAVTPTLSGSATGFSISGTTVSASSRGTTVGSERSINVIAKFAGTFDGQEVSANITIKQSANSQTLREITNEYTSSNPFSGQNTVKANGGTVQVYTFAIYDYSSGDTSKVNVSDECTFSNVTFGTWNTSTHTWTCPSAGTTVYAENQGASIQVTWGSQKTTYYLYREKNLESVKSTSGGVYTYGNVVAGAISNKTIPASGGSATATAGNGTQSWNKSAKITTYQYTSGATKDVTTEAASSGTNNVAPSIASINATASSKGTTVSTQTTVKSQFVTWSANGKSASGTMYIYQEANAVISTVKTVDIQLASGAGSSRDNPIPASGGRIQYNATGNTRTTYTSTSYKDEGFTPAIDGSANGFTVDQPSASAWYITAANRGTVVGDIRSVTVTASASGTTSKSVTVYQEANAIKSYNYTPWNITISANPTILPATGGTSTISRSCSRSKTPVYTSGATGTTSDEIKSPALTITTNPGGFTLTGNKLTAANNPIGTKTATVTASYSGATSKSVSVTQEAGPDGIGYMQIQGDGKSHPIFKVGGATRSVEPMSINETSETASDEDVSIFASIKKFLTKFV